MDVCTDGNSHPKFTELQKVSDFSDGFVIWQGHTGSASKLKAYLKSYLLECLPLHSTKEDDYYFA